jgi:hypothetical protein
VLGQVDPGRKGGRTPPNARRYVGPPPRFQAMAAANRRLLGPAAGGPAAAGHEPHDAFSPTWPPHYDLTTVGSVARLALLRRPSRAPRTSPRWCRRSRTSHVRGDLHRELGQPASASSRIAREAGDAGFTANLYGRQHPRRRGSKGPTRTCCMERWNRHRSSSDGLLGRPIPHERAFSTPKGLHRSLRAPHGPRRRDVRRARRARPWPSSGRTANGGGKTTAVSGPRSAAPAPTLGAPSRARPRGLRPAERGRAAPLTAHGLGRGADGRLPPGAFCSGLGRALPSRGPAPLERVGLGARAHTQFERASRAASASASAGPALLSQRRRLLLDRAAQRATTPPTQGGRRPACSRIAFEPRDRSILVLGRTTSPWRGGSQPALLFLNRRVGWRYGPTSRVCSPRRCSARRSQRLASWSFEPSPGELLELNRPVGGATATTGTNE